MRRAAAACVLAAFVAGCGSHERAREIPARLAPPHGCHVTVFFATRLVRGREATRHEIAAVRKTLAASSRIKTFSFVSKRLAFRRMARLEPDLVQGAPGNPLPAAYEIVPRAERDARPLIAELRHAKGVEHVSGARSC
jgi:cell division protein FtsX